MYWHVWHDEQAGAHDEQAGATTVAHGEQTGAAHTGAAGTFAGA